MLIDDLGGVMDLQAGSLIKVSSFDSRCGQSVCTNRTGIIAWCWLLVFVISMFLVIVPTTQAIYADFLNSRNAEIDTVFFLKFIQKRIYR